MGMLTKNITNEKDIYFKPIKIGYEVVGQIITEEDGIEIKELFEEVYQETDDKEQFRATYGSCKCVCLDLKGEINKLKIMYNDRHKIKQFIKLIEENENKITKDIIETIINTKKDIVEITEEEINKIFLEIKVKLIFSEDYITIGIIESSQKQIEKYFNLYKQSRYTDTLIHIKYTYEFLEKTTEKLYDCKYNLYWNCRIKDDLQMLKSSISKMLNSKI